MAILCSHLQQCTVLTCPSLSLRMHSMLDWNYSLRTSRSPRRTTHHSRPDGAAAERPAPGKEGV